jgi:2'-phosphotransferase
VDDVAALITRAVPGAGVTKTSMAMSKILRHDKKGRVLREDGFATAESLRLPLEGMLAAVVENNKQRFAVGRGVKTGKLYIRARQGHSVPVHLDLEEITDDDTVAMHGTTREAWQQIEKTGLNRMGRQHVHLAGGLPGEVLSGMRATSKVVVTVDVGKARADGIRFYKSENGVILSEGKAGVIDPKYFKQVQFL